MNKACILVFFLILSATLRGQTRIDITGAVEWDKMEINAIVSLDLASANIRLPTGRTQAESLISAEYLRLIRPGLLSIPVDSSSTIAGLIDRGEFSFLQAENLALGARMVPHALSTDLRSLSAAYSVSLAELCAGLIRHSRPAEIPRTLSAIPAAAYTGIIIIADEELPVHGKRSTALPLPCLFPKIWDTDMNLIYDRNMLELQNTQSAVMARYASADAIFRPGPSGLSMEIAALVGQRPLRILARRVFGERPTDPVIDRADALLIISSGENRRLLREGRVLIILNDSALKSGL
ncbi:MAG: polymerase [Treponema sp.]|jgi:hypothetical protein|nr:polymerase [Treponema sp.]